MDSLDLDGLAEISNGKAAILQYVGVRRQSDPADMELDTKEVIREETVTTTNTITLLTMPEIHQQGAPLMLTEEARDWLVKVTEGQSQCDLWFKHREGRITSSNVGKVIKHVNDDGSVQGATHSIIATIMGYYKTNSESQVAPLKWGKQMEPEALKAYKKHQKHHKKFCVQRTGLWISLDNPFLAASPDGLKECECCGTGIVEVKCPWIERQSTIAELLKSKSNTFLTQDGTNIKLSSGHPYYAQVQLQMYCTGRFSCDFVVFTASSSDNICVLSVPYNKTFVETLVRKCSIFWTLLVAKELEQQVVKSALIQKRSTKQLKLT